MFCGPETANVPPRPRETSLVEGPQIHVVLSRGTYTRRVTKCFVAKCQRRKRKYVAKRKEVTLPLVHEPVGLVGIIRGE